MPGVVQQQQHHHHRSTTKTTHKPYKSRFASKNALKDASKGKIEKGVRRTPHQHVMSKFDRRNQAKQRRINKSQEHAQAAAIFAGKDGAPRQVAVIPLCDDVDASVAVRALNKSLDLEADVPIEGRVRVPIDRFKQKIMYNTVRRELWSALSACQTADYVLFLLSPEQEVDDLGELLLRSIESQGISTVYTAVSGIDKIEPAKKRPQILSSLRSYITHFFPEQEKVFSLDSRQECQNAIRSFCTTTPKGIRWRDERSWMAVEDARWTDSSGDGRTGDVVLTGVVRGRNLKADRLVTVGEWGAFQIDKITAAPLEQNRKAKGNAMTVDAEGIDATLDQPSTDQDTLEDLAPEEAVMQDMDMNVAPSVATTERKGVLLDDQHYFSDDGEGDGTQLTVPRRVPKGTSRYQAAWYLGDVSDDGSDMEDFEDDDEQDDDDVDMAPGPADGLEGVVPAVDPTEAAQSEDPQSEAFDDRSPEDEEEDIAAYRARKTKDAAEDQQFPDVIELHPKVLARERLAKYRGLKSLRTSTWETEEDRLYQPEDWDRLLDINDYKRARSRVLRESLVGGVKPGTRVHIHLRSVPLQLQETYDPTQPLTLVSLLRHEHKRTAVNFSITLPSDYQEPLKSKEELIIQYGPRRLVINPLFSQSGTTPNDVHKFERYLHPGRSAIASFVAPFMWGPVPALFFKRSTSGTTPAEGADAMMDTDEAPSLTPALQLVGHGTAVPPSTSRIIAKRAVLTGEPYRINRKVVTVRYMFFNADDVAWYKAMPLWTNRGRQGVIKESLGTHGYFKATFDSRIGMQDAVGISLYKRMWPRTARALTAVET